MFRAEGVVSPPQDAINKGLFGEGQEPRAQELHTSLSGLLLSHPARATTVTSATSSGHPSCSSLASGGCPACVVLPSGTLLPRLLCAGQHASYFARLETLLQAKAVS